MCRFLVRILPISFLVATLFASFFSAGAFASSTKALSPRSLRLTPTTVVCHATEYPGHYGNIPTENFCTGKDAWFDYEPFPPNIDSGQPQIFWTDTGIPTSGTIISCNISAWFPNDQKYSTDTQTRYDFWYGSQWLGWVGHTINQNTAPAGWYRIATNLGINNSGQQVIVQVQDAGGSGELAFAAMQFTCTYVTG